MAHRSTQGGSGVDRMTNNFSPKAPSTTKGNARPGSDSGPATVHTIPAPTAPPQQPQQQVVAPSLHQLSPGAVALRSLVINHLAAVSFSGEATSSEFDPYIVGADENAVLAPDLTEVLNLAARVPNVNVKDVAERLFARKRKRT